MSMKKMLAVVAAASLVAVAAPAFANPFSDVPLNHWAYDAVEELSAKGIIDGYPDGTFKGTKAMTRYEIAAVVARAIANAGDEDVEQLKALVVEFGPELEALGVKVDGFDARLAKLEKGLSGWKISGQMRFDYNDDDTSSSKSGNGRTGFTTSRARIFLHRDMDNGLSFDLRLHANKVDRYFLTARDFFGVEGLQATIGMFCPDYMGEDGFYASDIQGAYDALLMDNAYRGAELRYSKGGLTIAGLAASNFGTGTAGVYDANASGDYYAGRIRFDIGEKAFVSANFLYRSEEYAVTESYEEADDGHYEKTSTPSAGDKSTTYWFGLGFNLMPGISLRGFYIGQDIDLINGSEPTYDDSPDAYRIILDIKQSVLKFTSLWVEYSEYGEGFLADTSSHYFDTRYTSVGDYYSAKDGALTTDHTELYISAAQQWTPKLMTFLAYQYIEADDVADGTDDDSSIYTIAVGYQYSPALYFELAYQDHDGKPGATDYEDKMFRFRTLFNF